MVKRSLGTAWRIIVGIACVVGLLALNDTIQDVRRSGAINWLHVGISIGIPLAAFVVAIAFGRRAAHSKR